MKLHEARNFVNFLQTSIEGELLFVPQIYYVSLKLILRGDNDTAVEINRLLTESGFLEVQEHIAILLILRDAQNTPC